MTDSQEKRVAQGDPGVTLSSVLGEVVFLMMSPPSHKHLFITDLEWLVMPPLTLRQFRLWRQGNRPIAFASWAFLSDEVGERVMGGVRRLKPADWKSGDNAWLMDVIAPNPEFAKQMVDELKKTVFADRVLKGLRPRADGTGSEVVEL